MNALVLVETRRVSVDKCLDGHLKYLPADWEPILVCSRLNEDMTDIKKVLIPPITSVPQYYRDYNRLFANPDFWDNFINYERVMICHQDSRLLRTGIDEFMEWDYVGAPWKFQDHGGNGGLSLRNPVIMRSIAAGYPYSLSEYEDVFFSNRMFNYGIGKLAPREVCKKFSCETIFELGTLGYHGIEKYLTPAQCEGIKLQYKK